MELAGADFGRSPGHLQRGTVRQERKKMSKAPWTPSEDQVNHYRAVAERDAAAKAARKAAAQAAAGPLVSKKPSASESGRTPDAPAVEETFVSTLLELLAPLIQFARGPEPPAPAPAEPEEETEDPNKRRLIWHRFPNGRKLLVWSDEVERTCAVTVQAAARGRAARREAASRRDARVPEPADEAVAPAPTVATSAPSASEAAITDASAPSASEDSKRTEEEAPQALEPIEEIAAPAEIAAPVEAPLAPYIIEEPEPADEEEVYDGTLHVELSPEPRMLFRRIHGFRCTDHWSSVPLREPPILPEGLVLAASLSYYDDAPERIDLNVMHALMRDHAFDKLSSIEASWTLWWHAGLLRTAELSRLATLHPHQRVNKLPGAAALTDKAQMWRSVRDAAARHGEGVFGFVPQTFVLPDEIREYEECMRAEEEQGHYWILKPSNRSQGQGIFVHRALPESNGRAYAAPEKKKKRKKGKPESAKEGAEGGKAVLGAPGGVMPHSVRTHMGVASRYIDPYLIDGLKFDVRLYVLVTCVHPLCVYLYDDGLVRFATERYDLTKPLDRRCMHLTNYSLNKKADSFVANTDEEDEGSGSKWSVGALKARLAADLGESRTSAMWKEIDDLVAKTIIAAEPTLVAATDAAFPGPSSRGEPARSCFQIFGFDVMLDAECKPWLLEVNNDPALRTASPLDLKIKSRMLIDAFNVVGLPVQTTGGDGESGEGLAADAATVQMVDAEYRRSHESRWSRLLPCERERQQGYRQWMAPSSSLNDLGFAVPE